MSNQKELLTLLRARREELAERVSRIHRDRTREDGPVQQDFAEQAQERENDEVLDRLEPVAEAELAQFDRAIARAEAGEYGVCEICGEGIDARRLALLPQATTCASCASRAEQSRPA
ncbi:MAG: TraR/DksA C4-type zinc finger protein [Nevskiales bacterium]|nr:TraR/DksA C4-type zinc finger protein [Nevskiales bacterium]